MSLSRIFLFELLVIKKAKISKDFKRNFAAARIFTVAQNKMSHRTKRTFSATDRDFLTKIPWSKGERSPNLWCSQVYIFKYPMLFLPYMQMNASSIWKNDEKISTFTPAFYLHFEPQKNITVLFLHSASFLPSVSAAAPPPTPRSWITPVVGE